MLTEKQKNSVDLIVRELQILQDGLPKGTDDQWLMLQQSKSNLREFKRGTPYPDEVG